MSRSTRAFLGAGGLGLATGLLWFLLEMTARFADSQLRTGDRPPSDYPAFLAYYSLTGLAAGLAVFSLGRAATAVRTASAGIRRTAAVLGVAVAGLLTLLLLRALSWLELEPRVALRHLGAALLVAATVAVVAWGLVRIAKRGGAARLLLYGAAPAAALLAGHLVFLRATGVDRDLDRWAAKPKTGRPNVLLISIDTLRADRLHAYGYERRISPRIDLLARQGALFERAVAHSPWTQPSFATILTSTYPSQHGSFVLLAPPPAAGGDNAETVLYQSFLQEDEVTLAELLLEHGYTTFAVQAICEDEDQQRFDQGFQVYLCRSQFVSSMWTQSLLGIGADKLVRLFGGRVERRPGGSPPADEVFASFAALISRVLPQPFFAWVSFRDPHSPYLLRQDGVPPEDARVVASLRPEDAGVPTAALSAAYDDEIRFVDHYVGRVLDLLRERRILDDTVVVLTSDHGEEFDDHFAEVRSASAAMRGRFHGHSLYSELLHVPLLIRYPPVIPPGTRIAALARHVDLVPTVLDLAGVDAGVSGDRFEGRSLLPLITGGADSGETRLAYGERNLFGAQRRSIQDGRYKLILEVESGDLELYDLAADPEERRNLASERRDETERLQALLERWAAEMGPVVPPSPQAAAGDDGLERLRALGYVR